MKTTNKPSLIGMAYRRAGVILLVMVLAVGVKFGVTAHYTRSVSEAHGERMVAEQAQLLAQQLELYRRVLRHVARQSEVHDMLLLADERAAQRWAANARHYLPGSIGMALLTPEGGVLGTPVTLRVGPECLADLEAHLADLPVQNPPVHAEKPQFAHFDLVETVRDHAGETLGLVFASFDLEGLEATLAGILQEDHLLSLIDGNAQLIAQAGRLEDEVAAAAFRHRVEVPGTTWHLELAQRAPDNRPIYVALGGTSLIAAMFIVLLVMLLTSRLIRIFVAECHQVKGLLERVVARQAIEPGIGRFRETDDILPLIEKIADNIRRQQLTLTQQSLSDELTGLPNRRHFNQEMQRALELARRGISMGLLLFDIDHFKDINDSGGHAAGDRVLQALAAALRDNARKTDFVARLGGDEFAALLFNIQPGDAQRWLERFKTVLEEQAARHGVHTVPSLSAGLARVDARDSSINAVVRRADQALYVAKAQGRGRLEVPAD